MMKTDCLEDQPKLSKNPLDRGTLLHMPSDQARRASTRVLGKEHARDQDLEAPFPDRVDTLPKSKHILTTSMLEKGGLSELRNPLKGSLNWPGVCCAICRGKQGQGGVY